MGTNPTLVLELLSNFLAELLRSLEREKFYAQALLEEKERAETASRVKSEFLAAVSHQLRIPLTGIIGMAQLLNLDCLLPGQKEQVEDILKASEHLLSLVNDLLDLTKLEAGKMDLHPSVVDLKTLIEEIANMLYLQANMKGLELVVNYEQDAPHFVVTDARIIRQILLNLISNALKFTEKGYILIQVKCLQEKTGTAVLEFQVQDTGVGIAEADRKIIFDRFSRVYSTNFQQRYGGSGLGLTLTKHLVELLGGNIWVESEEGKGSAFIYTIPFSLRNISESTSPWEPYKAKVRILIVDDSLRGAVLYKHIASPTAQVVAGKEALQTLLTAERYGEPYDVVIIDQQLASIDSTELGQLIQKQLTRHIPMLMLLMQPSPITVQEEAKQAGGFFACLVKPLQPSELIIGLTAAWENWAEKIRAQQEINKSQFSKQPRVLLVEDDLIIQKIHKKMIENTGCKVDLAKDGYEALAFFERGYDLILMDVGLPGISGIEVTRMMRQQEAATKKHTPIIAMTAFVHEQDKNNCLAVGMDEVATKPISADALKALLSRWTIKQ